MGTKNKPGTFDCYAKAEPDEPMFILLGRDADAAKATRDWAGARLARINRGLKPESDRAMVQEAFDCADAMDAYRRQRNGK